MEIENMHTIIAINQTQELAKELQQQNKRVVLVGGCFDLLHYGHVTLLNQAKQQGDILIVLLESDARIQKLKGSDRPLHTQKQRAQMLTSLKSVDFVILLPSTVTNEDYDMLVKQIQPAIIATTKGSESLRYIERQAGLVDAAIYLVDIIPNLSTSRILDIVAKEL